MGSVGVLLSRQLAIVARVATEQMKRSGQKLRKLSEVESGERGMKHVSHFSVQQWKDLRRGVRQKLPPCFVIVLFLLCPPVGYML